jgi:hypothetical protein
VLGLEPGHRKGQAIVILFVVTASTAQDRTPCETEAYILSQYKFQQEEAFHKI